MKAVLIAIQPYYVFLIIAQLLGWDIPQKKTEEVRKDYPKDSAWNKKTHIYCSKNKKSFNRIPKKYQPLMERFLGKVIGEFLCDSIRKGRGDNTIAAYYHNNPDETCLTDQELVMYANCEKPLCFWHITELKVYEELRELGEFWKAGKCMFNTHLGCTYKGHCFRAGESNRCGENLARPPQSWCYVEAL